VKFGVNASIDKIRAVFFDFGGVLASEGFREGLQAIGRKHGVDPERTFDLGTEAVYDSGYITGQGTETKFWELFRRRAGIAETDEALRSEILTRFTLRPQMLALVQALRNAGLLVAILSDQTDWLDWLNDRDGFFDEFERVFNSFHLGKGKRDPTIFDDVTRLVGVDPNQALFVDDNPGNVQRAQERGLKVLLFRDEKRAIAWLGRLVRHTQQHRRH
jgi:putative hydrolase of the HAD superfamily